MMSLNNNEWLPSSPPYEGGKKKRRVLHCINALGTLECLPYHILLMILEYLPWYSKISLCVYGTGFRSLIDKRLCGRINLRDELRARCCVCGIKFTRSDIPTCEPYGFIGWRKKISFSRHCEKISFSEDHYELNYYECYDVNITPWVNVWDFFERLGYGNTSSNVLVRVVKQLIRPQSKNKYQLFDGGKVDKSQLFEKDGEKVGYFWSDFDFYFYLDMNIIWDIYNSPRFQKWLELLISKKSH